MKAVVQRVAWASSTPGGSIGPGLVVLLGIALSNSWQLVISHESDNENGAA